METALKVYYILTKYVVNFHSFHSMQACAAVRQDGWALSAMRVSLLKLQSVHAILLSYSAITNEIYLPKALEPLCVYSNGLLYCMYCSL